MLIFMFYGKEEFVKTQLEINIGVFVLEEILDICCFDLIDCFDVIKDFLPPNYIVSRENYIFSSY